MINNNMDEGYIKFKAMWREAPALPWAELAELDYWRNRLYDAGLIGAYPDGIGYGNISRRWDEAGRFVISGSATGNEKRLSAQHYALVQAVEVAANSLVCEGPILASSESMSHAVIYRHGGAGVGAVIHVHHLGLWEALLHQVPTTEEAAAYGTPEMALSIERLLKDTDLKTGKLFVMAGHREGIFAFGSDLAEAGERLLGIQAAYGLGAVWTPNSYCESNDPLTPRSTGHRPAQ